MAARAARRGKWRGERPKSKPKLNQVIAERELSLATKKRKKQKVFVRFGKPLPLPRHPDYSCVYQIEGLHEGHTITRRIYGFDSIQALDLAMRMALVELVCTNAYDEGRLTFLGSYDLGLPIMDPIKVRIKKDPKAVRDAMQAAYEVGAGFRKATKRRAPKARRTRK